MYLYRYLHIMSFEIKLKSAALHVNALVVVRPLEW